MMGKTILVVEDEAKIATVTREYLEDAGYKAFCLDRGDTVVAHLQNNHVDLIILDILLPGMDGMQVCREIRKFSRVPIIMLTARVKEIDRIIGLELGADDYICKPFSPREMVARVNAVLRRMVPEQEEKTVGAGPIVIETDSHKASIHGRALELTPTEFDLLAALVSQPTRVFSRAELIGRIQGYDFEGYERTIDTHVKNVRRKLARFFPDQTVIQSVYGIGYKLSLPDNKKPATHRE